MNVSSLDYNVVEHSQPNRSVTLIAKMSKGTNDENNQIWFREIGGITIKSEHIPLLIGTLIGAFLILLLIVAFLLWKCCISSEENKTREAVNISTIEKSHFSNQNYSNAFSDPRTPRTYSSRVVELIPEHDGPIYWVYKNHEFPPVPYGSTGDTEPCTVSNIEVIRPPRPRSNPTVPPSVSSLVDDFTLPEISEFCAHTCQYSLSDGLDECYVKGYNVNNYKTRSLPSCVRHKRRSSNDDDANNFYDKVNFSKKRKNRMRNDEAAIIALSKSRSQFFNKDTDTLVDNEAVIVYDERTAL